MKPSLILRLLILVAVLIPVLETLAIAQPATVAKTPTGTFPVTEPNLVADHYRGVVARPEFQEAPDTAIDSRFENWLTQWFKRLGDRIGNFTYASQMPAFESLLMTLLVVFSISVLIYILVRLTRHRDGTDAEPSVANSGPKSFRPPEFYEAEIQAAIQDRDWHGAWLAAWRQFLSRLEHRNLVEADRTRTNREYLAQLRGKPLPTSSLRLLVTLVDAYDRFIYGRTSIGESDWNHFRQSIAETSLLLHLDEKRAMAGQAAKDAS